MKRLSDPFPALLLAFVGPLAVALAMVPLRTTQVAPALAVVMVLPVVAAALLGGWRPGALAAITGALAFDVLLTAPFGSLRILGAEDALVTLVLLVVGLVISHLVADRRRSDERAEKGEHDLASLRRYAGIDAGSDDRGWLIRSACAELCTLLEADDVEYRRGPVPAGATLLAHGKVIVPAAASDGNGNATAPLRDATVALPVDSSGRHVGHFIVRFRRSGPFGVPLQRRAQAVAVADMLASAMVRSAPQSPN